MNSNIFFKKLSFVFLILILVSCDTDDILPTIELTSDSTTLSEDNGAVTVSVTLNATATNTMIIPLIISGTATESVDYTLSSSEITINQGSDSGSITINTIQDQEVEGPETIIISLGNVNNVLVLSNPEITITILDDDSDTDSDGVLDVNDDCIFTPGPAENNGCPWLGFLINEVLYDPASDISGDANGDGVRDALDDEFIEFFNSGIALDLSGYTISDSSALRHTFPTGTVVPSNGAIVVFGGESPTGSFGGSIIQTASSGQLNLSNSGDLITLQDAMGNIVLTFDIEPLSNNPNESYTRNPDLTGDFAQHTGIEEANGTLFSPGTKIDGSTF